MINKQNPGGGRIFRTCPDRPWDPPSLLHNRYRVFRGGKSGRGVTLTPHPFLMPRSRKGRTIPLLPLWAVRPAQSLSACTSVHFTFIEYSGLWKGMFDIVDTRDALLGASVSYFDNCMITRAAYRPHPGLRPPPCRPSPGPTPRDAWKMHLLLNFWRCSAIFWNTKGNVSLDPLALELDIYSQQTCMIYTIAVCKVKKIPDDRQRNCPKHVKFYSKNKFEKWVHLVGFNRRVSFVWHTGYVMEYKIYSVVGLQYFHGIRKFSLKMIYDRPKHVAEMWYMYVLNIMWASGWRDV